MNPELMNLREKALALPLLPGVYIMLDAEHQIIYIGKAKKLKNRVSSYFHGEHLPKVEAMVDKVRDFNVIVAGSEFEALVLENSLIKQHKPHYNILLKDDKGYPFIALDEKSQYPRFTLASRADNKNLRYFGPFGSRSVTKNIITAICRAFKLPDCGKRFPNDFGKERPCLNYHMKLCEGWCENTIPAEEYRDRIRQAVLILTGKSDALVEQLRTEMEQAAEELRFESAALLRDQIRAVEGLANRQRVIATTFSDTDAVGFFRGPKSCFTVLHFKKGTLMGKDTEMIEEPLESDEEAYASFLCRYYLKEHVNIPRILILPMYPEDHEDIQKLLAEKAEHKCVIDVPQRGERLRLSESAMTNAKEEVIRSTTFEERRLKTLEWLQNALSLPNYPKRIEAFDISNLGDTGIVSVMTVHINGKPVKNQYRKFRIKDLDGPDDYASMYQVVYRRFKRYLDGDPKFAELPDLLLIDGGSVHAGVAEKALAELGLDLPVYGMVKDDRHRTRALISAKGEETGISGNQAIFSLIGNIQEETHNASIGYQKSLRSESWGSELDKIPGIGKKRREELLKHFKSVKAIRNAELGQLRDVLPINAAKEVYAYFHTEEIKE